jgi:hypothetical protein
MHHTPDQQMMDDLLRMRLLAIFGEGSLFVLYVDFRATPVVNVVSHCDVTSDITAY